MAIKRSSKISTSFSASSMTDLVFLLLVFFVLATTLINPINAMKVSVPTSDTNKTKDASSASITIEQNVLGVSYKLNNNIECATLAELDASLEGYYASSMNDADEVTMSVAFICDKDATTMQQFVDVASKIQEINLRNRESNPTMFPEGVDKYKLSLATKESE